MQELKILLADDHKILRNGIKMMLSQQNAFIPIIEEAEDGLEAIKKAHHEKFDVILLDVNMPKKDGLSVARYLTSRQKKVKILALTMYKEEYIIKQMVDAGALGYILKDAGVEELTTAILAVSRNIRYYSNEVSQALLTINSSSKKKAKAAQVVEMILSKREREIIGLIANEYTNTEIAEKLSLSKRTIDGHRNNIILKLRIKNTAGLVRYAYQNGIL